MKQGRQSRWSQRWNTTLVLLDYLTCCHNLVGGHCQVGSLTGAVASKKVTEAPKGSLSTVGNRALSVKA